jgi:hypothetical protein
MTIEPDFAGALRGARPETNGAMALAGNLASAMHESVDCHFSNECDEAEYLEALRNEFKRRAPERNSW